MDDKILHKNMYKNLKAPSHRIKAFYFDLKSAYYFDLRINNHVLNTSQNLNVIVLIGLEKA
ncbi:hypothetical protein J6T66_06075 [bacterium]|nr:hypothetical protein [bacterium]